MFDNKSMHHDCFKEAVCINSKRVYDACRDRECLEDLKVYFCEKDQEIIKNALSVKLKSADVIYRLAGVIGLYVLTAILKATRRIRQLAALYRAWPAPPSVVIYCIPAYCLLHFAHCLLHIAYSLLHFAHCL